jgi:hypothetical protein
MTSTHKNLLLIAFFQMLVFSTFSQVINHDVHGLHDDWDCSVQMSSVSHTGTSVTIQTPSESCDDNSLYNKYFVQIDSNCPTDGEDSDCNFVTITYDCLTGNWRSSIGKFGSTCGDITGEGQTNILERVGVWKIEVVVTQDGLMLKSIGNCTGNITLTGGTYRKLYGLYCERIHIPQTHVLTRVQSSPNPTTGLVNIRFEGIKEGAANIVIYNNIGSIVGEISTIETYKGQNETQIDLGNLPAGLYNIAIKQGEQIITQRIQKL